MHFFTASAIAGGCREPDSVPAAAAAAELAVVAGAAVAAAAAAVVAAAVVAAAERTAAGRGRFPRRATSSSHSRTAVSTPCLPASRSSPSTLPSRYAPRS